MLSGLFEMRKIGDPGGAGAVQTALATLAAFVVGYASIAWLLKWLATHSTMVFVVYRVALGVLVIALTAAGDAIDRSLRTPFLGHGMTFASASVFRRRSSGCRSRRSARATTPTPTST